MKKRADGRYIQWVTIKVNGEPRRKAVYGKTQAELARKLVELEANQTTVAGGITFEAAARLWDAYHEKMVRPAAHTAYGSAYKRAVAYFGDEPVNSITARDIQLYINSIARQGFALRTVNLHIALFRLIFDYGIKEGGYCDNNPAVSVSAPKGLKVTQRELPPDNAAQKAKEYTEWLLPQFLLYTGCRKGEALALTYDDIDLEKKEIHINKAVTYPVNAPVISPTKTKNAVRTIPILQSLKIPPKKGKYLFGGDKPLSKTEYRRRWDKFEKFVGENVTAHQFRHLYATILYEAGIDEFTAMRIMGHSSIVTTRNIYTHLRRSQLDDARKVLDKFNTKEEKNGN